MVTCLTLVLVRRIQNHTNIPPSMNDPKCSLCRFRKTIYKHPWNREPHRGSILDPMGYVCTVTLEPNEEWSGVFQELDGPDVGCELFTPKL